MEYDLEDRSNFEQQSATEFDLGSGEVDLGLVDLGRTLTEREQNKVGISSSDAEHLNSVIAQTAPITAIAGGPGNEDWHLRMKRVTDNLTQQYAEPFKNAEGVLDASAKIFTGFWGSVFGGAVGLTAGNAASAAGQALKGDIPKWVDIRDAFMANWIGGIQKGSEIGVGAVGSVGKLINPAASEKGDAILGNIEATLHTVRNSIGDAVFTQTGDPTLATIGYVIPDALLSAAALKATVGGKPSAVPIPKEIIDFKAKIVGKELQNPFGGMNIEDWPTNLNQNQFRTLVQSRAQLQENLLLDQNIPEVKAATDNLTKIVTDLESRRVKTKGYNNYTRVSTDAVIDLASTKQQLSMTDAQVQRAIEGKGKEVVIHYDKYGNTKLKSGLAEALVAKELGITDVPVRQVFSGKLPDEVAASLAVDAQRYFDASRMLAEKIDADIGGLSWKKLQRRFFDRNAAVKDYVRSYGGEKGDEAVMSYEMAAGANTSAMYQLDKYLGRTFRGLNEEQVNTLNNVIRARNVLDVDAFRSSRGKKLYTRGFVDGNEVRPFTGAQARAYLQELRKSIGDDQMAFYEEKAGNYFEAMQDLLKFRRDEGLISAEDFDNMQGLDYVHTKYLQVDPLLEKLGGKKISVSSSGVEYLQGGQLKLLDMRADNLMRQQTAAVFRRAFENRATRDLAAVADTADGNTVVKRIVKEDKEKNPRNLALNADGSVGEIPQGWDTLHYMENGELQSLAVDSNIAANWKYLSRDMTAESKAALRMLTAVTPTKLANVGLNPTFFIRDTPRNIMHAFLASGKSMTGKQVYSRDLAIFGMQLGRNLLNTAQDAFMRQGKAYEDLVNSGGMPGLMSHIGRSDTAFLDKNFPTSMRALTYFNDTAEIWMRLAIRDQAMRQGLSSKEANHVARANLDYGQSGTYAYAMENIIPFFNANMQAWYSAGRGIARDPARLASLGLYTTAGAFMLGLWNNFYNPEAADAIDSMHLTKGLNIVLPPSFNTMGSDGLPMYGYFNIPVEGYAAPFMSAGNWLAAAYTKRRLPDEVAKDTMLSLLPAQSIVPPLVNTFLSFNNFDPFYARQIWKGNGEEPWAEYLSDQRGNFTPQMYRDIGEFMHEHGLGGLNVASPERLRHAAHTLIGNHPIFTGIELFGNSMFGEEPQALVNATKNEMVMRMMKFSGVFKTSSGMGNLYDDEEGAYMKSQMKLNNDKVEKLLQDWKLGHLSIKDAASAIARVPPHMDTPAANASETQRMLRRMMTSVEFHSAVDRLRPKGAPPEQWWIGLSNSPPRQAAVKFYNYWETRSNSEKPALLNFVRALKSVWTGEAEDQFRFLRDKKDGDE